MRARGVDDYRAIVLSGHDRAITRRNPPAVVTACVRLVQDQARDNPSTGGGVLLRFDAS